MVNTPISTPEPVQFEAANFAQSQPIDGYGPGFFRIGGAVYDGAVLVLANSIISWGGYDDRAPLLALAGNIDVLFFGTGVEAAYIAKDLRVDLETLRIGVEPVATPVACRTYNVLLAEGRRVGAALLPV